MSLLLNDLPKFLIFTVRFRSVSTMLSRSSYIYVLLFLSNSTAFVTSFKISLSLLSLSFQCSK